MNSKTAILPNQRLLVDVKGVASLLNVSPRHVESMDASGRLGPRAVALGACKRFRVAELRAWVRAGCPSRDVWVEQDADAVRLCEGRQA